MGNRHPKNTVPALQKTVRKKSESYRNLIKAAALAVMLGGFLSVIRFSPLGEYLSLAHLGTLEEKLAGFHQWAPVVFLLGGALAISLGSPRSIFSILGGMFFGFWQGTLLTLGAALLGSITIFLLTRWLGRPLFKQRVNKYLAMVEAHVTTNGFLIVVLLRQLPLTCILVNVLIGLTTIPMRTFLWGSVVGLLPETVIFTLFGSSVQENFIWRVSIASSLLILLALAVRIFYKKSPLAQKLSDQMTKQEC
jgi:uncharacterized membrane protein YdjX (TVP38/TMEM64 family)